ncbi:SOS response-associated peptidase family protein [Falsihalocynthiibacter sp. BN13B15]|uniref:SOS response-associated peptidase family protein n=1 Tax=Falsihalocynthiibacter sp. BN13B15 TaxID=3240871 RepID=UPI00350F8A91
MNSQYTFHARNESNLGEIELKDVVDDMNGASMCGRIIDPNLRGTEFERSELKINPFPRRYNIKPTQEVYVMRDTLQMARWGLILSWHRGGIKDWKANTINARWFQPVDATL